jgi:hypothetical protein
MKLSTSVKPGPGGQAAVRNIADVRLPVMLGGALCVALLVATLMKQTLPTDAILPAVTALTFACAALVGVAGAVSGRGVRLAMLEFAGVLTCVGIFTAAAIEPDQIIRLMQSAED